MTKLERIIAEEIKKPITPTRTSLQLQRIKNAAGIKRGLEPSRQPAGGMSKLEADMQVILEEAGLPAFEQQHEPFKHLGRKHRLDFAWLEQKVVLEVNGGAHAVKRQMTADTEKLFLLQREGWFVIVATKEHVYNGVAVARVRDALEMRGQK